MSIQAILFLSKLFDRCLLVAGYRGLMLVGPIHPESMSPLGSPASRTIEFDGVLLLARLVQVLGTTYVFSVTQSDDAEESGVIMYKVIDSRRPEFLTSFKLPPS